MTQSLFERLGGEAAVDEAVDRFYRKVLTDDTISHFFETTDMAAQHAKQKGFLTMAFGGPNNYSGMEMRAAHKPMVENGLNDAHFDAVATHLQTTLEDMGVAKELIDEVLAIAGSTRDDVLNR